MFLAPVGVQNYCKNRKTTKRHLVQYWEKCLWISLQDLQDDQMLRSQWKLLMPILPWVDFYWLWFVLEHSFLANRSLISTLWRTEMVSSFFKCINKYSRICHFWTDSITVYFDGGESIAVALPTISILLQPHWLAALLMHCNYAIYIFEYLAKHCLFMKTSLYHCSNVLLFACQRNKEVYVVKCIEAWNWSANSWRFRLCTYSIPQSHVVSIAC